MRATLEQLPCCVADAEGKREGDPLNFVIVGESADVLNSLSRSGWSFTHRIDFRTIRREVGAAIAGTSYPVAPVSSLYVFDRKQDVALQRARRSISQRNHMRLWQAPFRFEERPVWVGQVSRDIGVKVTPKSPTLTTHIIDPQVDATREYLLHSLIAQGFVERFGFVKGSASGTPAAPRYNLTGDPYHSDGMRLVVMLSAEPMPPDEIRSLQWENRPPPIAAGQSKAAERNVRPLEPPVDGRIALAQAWPPDAAHFLFVSQGIDGIESGGPACREISEDDADCRREQERQQVDARVEQVRHVHEPSEPDRRTRRQCDADQPTEARQHDRLDQELQQHLALQRADRESRADLARPFGDGHQHDVHDADPADQEAHRRDCSEQHRQDLRRTGQGLR